MTYDSDPNQYEDTTSESGVVAHLAERATLSENSVETVDVSVPGAEDRRELVRLLHREGDKVVETLLDPQAFADQPRRKTGTVQIATVPSLIRYLQRHRQAGTEVWVDHRRGRFEAVLDDHIEGDDTEAHQQAGRGLFRAVCTLQHTPDWQHWIGQNGKLLSQTDFAEHVEAGLHNIATPPAADFLEVAQSLHGSRNVQWKSGTRLSDGQVAFRYEEDNQARAAGGVEIPQTFTLALAPFEGTAPVEVVASFRWRLNDGRVLLGYRLQRPEIVAQEAIAALIDQVEAEAHIDVLLGWPRGSGSAIDAGRITPGTLTADVVVQGRIVR